MPLYSDLGLYGGPSSSSTYSNLYLSSPYSTHSSILAANYRSPVLPKTLPRSFARNYKPHLATISESQTISPLRRKFSPTLLLQHHSSPKYNVAKPISINTADIDVSVNKYRKYDRKAAELKKSPEKAKSPSPSLERVDSYEEKGNSDEQPAIRRDRALVRLHTIHKKDSPRRNLQNGDAPKSWRQVLYADEPKEKRSLRRTPGELLVDKFLIRTKEEDERLRSEGRKLPRKDSVMRKTKPKESNFHKICRAISSETINENLNPGQPEEIVRRQSKQLDEEALDKIRRNSEILNELANPPEMNEEGDENNNNTEKRKRKVTKKKSNEKLILEHDAKTGLHRRGTQKKIRRTSTDSSFHSDLDDESEKAYQEAIRDISQVEVEQIKSTPKPKITATVEIDPSPTLKAVIEDVEIVESPKKPKKFKYNVTVEEVESKRKSQELDVDSLPETKLNVKNSAMALKREKSKSPAPDDEKRTSKRPGESQLKQIVEDNEELNRSLKKAEQEAAKVKAADNLGETTKKISSLESAKDAAKKTGLLEGAKDAAKKTSLLETAKDAAKKTSSLESGKDEAKKTCLPESPKDDAKKSTLAKVADDKKKPSVAETSPKGATKPQEELPSPVPEVTKVKLQEETPTTPKETFKVSANIQLLKPQVNEETAKLEATASNVKDSEVKPKIQESTKIPESPKTAKIPSALNEATKPLTSKLPETPKTPATPKLPETPKTPATPKLPETPKTPSTPMKSPDSPNSPTSPTRKTNAKKIVPKLAPKEENSSGENFWEKIGTRESVYLDLRKRKLQEKRYAALIQEEEEVEPSNGDEKKTLGEKKLQLDTKKIVEEKNTKGKNVENDEKMPKTAEMCDESKKSPNSPTVDNPKSPPVLKKQDKEEVTENPKSPMGLKKLQDNDGKQASEEKQYPLEAKKDAPTLTLGGKKVQDNPGSPITGKKLEEKKDNPGSPLAAKKLEEKKENPGSPLVTKKLEEKKENPGSPLVAKKLEEKKDNPGSPLTAKKLEEKKDNPGSPLAAKKFEEKKDNPASPLEAKKETPLSPLGVKKVQENPGSPLEERKETPLSPIAAKKLQGNDENPGFPLIGKKLEEKENPAKKMQGKEDNPGSPLTAKKMQGKENKDNPGSPVAAKKLQGKEEKENPGSPLAAKKFQAKEEKEKPGSPLPGKKLQGTEEKDNPGSPNKLQGKEAKDNPGSPLAAKKLQGKQDNPLTAKKLHGKEEKEAPGSPLSAKKLQGTEENPGSPLAGKKLQGKEEKENPGSPLAGKKVQGKEENPGSPLGAKKLQGKEEKDNPGSPLAAKKLVKKDNPGSPKSPDEAKTPKSPSGLKLQDGKSAVVAKKDKEAPNSPLGGNTAKPKAKLKKEKSEEKRLNTEMAQMRVTDVTVPAQTASLDVIAQEEKKLISKRSLVNKSGVEDPDLHVFVVPSPPVQKEPSPPKFVPLQSNRLSAWMHPFKKPEQYDVCPIQRYARPKTIRHRYYPRSKAQKAADKAAAEGREDDDDDDEEEEEESVEEESSAEEESGSGSETGSDDEDDSDEEESDSIDLDEMNDVWGYGKVGASTSSDDSGFDSSTLDNRKNKECDVNIHKKCEKLTANLCGVNQKLIVEAIESVKKGCSERDSPTSNPAHNPAFALDSAELAEEFSQSSTFVGFQKSGRITPPATTIPRFRKYNIEDFNFLKVLGKGSFGKVLLAELKDTEYYYAIKCLKKDVVLEDDDVECTLIERKVLALGTKHPYLCHLLCTFQTESHLFFVMEYLNGGDLMFHIQKSGRFPEPRARFYAAEIVSGLKFLHSKGIVYRDLKLDNILLDFDGHVRIADFGMCKLQIFLDRTADTFCGTPDYMAPEIIKGQHYNQNVDWWSFGVLLYEMLIGQSPFSGCDEDELFWSICNEIPRLPKFLSKEATSILTLLLEKDATKRLGNKFCHDGDIMDQPFFHPVDWELLNLRKLEPPFKPCLQHPLDTQYFDRTFTVEKAKLTPIEQDILQSMDQAQFQGFSYTNPNATDR